MAKSREAKISSSEADQLLEALPEISRTADLATAIEEGIPYLKSFFTGWYRSQNPEARWKDEEPYERRFEGEWRSLQAIIQELENARLCQLQLTVGKNEVIAYKNDESIALPPDSILPLTSTRTRHPYNKDIDMPVPYQLYPATTGFLGDGEIYMPLIAFAKTLSEDGDIELVKLPLNK